MNRHRQLFPHQYAHALCGRQVRIAGTTTTFRVERVVRALEPTSATLYAIPADCGNESLRGRAFRVSQCVLLRDLP